MSTYNSGDSARSLVQKLPELIEWYLTSQEIELIFVPNPRMAGRIAPEFDFQYSKQGRRISERGLGMAIQSELSRMNYNYQLGNVISQMTTIAWNNYVTHCEYPEWMEAERVKPRRAVGRPRKTPPKIEFPAPPVEGSVNTPNAEVQE